MQSVWFDNALAAAGAPTNAVGIEATPRTIVASPQRTEPYRVWRHEPMMITGTIAASEVATAAWGCLAQEDQRGHEDHPATDPEEGGEHARQQAQERPRRDRRSRRQPDRRRARKAAKANTSRREVQALMELGPATAPARGRQPDQGRVAPVDVACLGVGGRGRARR